MADTDDAVWLENLQMTFGDFKKRMIACGYVKDGDLTPLGRQRLRTVGVQIPDDKSLLQLGLEALAEEVVAEEMQRLATHPTSETPQ